MTVNSLFSRWVLGGVTVLGATIGMCAQARAESASAGMTLSEADRLAVFKAAGAVQKKGMWVICDGPDAAGGASIESVRDLNGDGRPEAVVSEGGTYCYGRAEAGFKLLSKQADGSWRVMTSNNGMAGFLKTRGVGGWPDISVGGPGFCFPVQRWNGKTYELNRFEYEGKRCKPPQ
jgi:hypothetical protein